MLNKMACLHFPGVENRQATAWHRTKMQADLYSPSQRLVLIFGIQKVPDILSHENSDSALFYFSFIMLLSLKFCSSDFESCLSCRMELPGKPLQVPWF